ncbi:MAG: Fis family transcriptional regulator [Ignavibacteriae bacterium HGW-Ignavibacteriae-2]|nr:MAG: Fis family transcriptional regulator [Ignavibacteriae bacterium HGW-Ignavibacteriae-2]
MKNILIASKKSEAVETIKDFLSNSYLIDTASSNKTSLDLFTQKKYDFLFIDLGFLETEDEEIDYKKQLKQYWQIFPDAEIIILSSQQDIRDAVDAVKAGASDYLTFPVKLEDIIYVVERIEQHSKMRSELLYLRNFMLTTDTVFQVKTNSPLMREVFNNVRSVAHTDSTVLLTGETGTGKGFIAKLIHQYSLRAQNQFISVHCGAIPDNLLESDLFGHEKGAFTGAVRRKPGKFEIADGGTIFLDEVGTVSTSMQIKLLQVLQDKMFYRVGGELPVKSDVRIIAATNSDLSAMSEEGSFRTDLYYRLNVFQIEMPPLRDRLEDITLLMEVILKRLNRFNNKEIFDVHPEVLEAFNEYDWPGNIRELENLLERAHILETTQVLTPKSFPIRLFKEKYKKYVSTVDTNKTLEAVRKIEIERLERDYLNEMLSKFNGKINLTAKAAGIGERQLHKLMIKYNLKKENHKNKSE